jgi:ABC-type transport system substrate-binding protein
MALYAQVLTSLEPSLASLFVSTNIPGPENDNSGQNWTRTNIPEADEPLLETDSNPDPEERSAAGAEADDLLAESATSIPLDPLPNISIWSDQIIGPKVANPIWGSFANMEEWGLAS